MIKATKSIMGMTAVVCIIDPNTKSKDIKEIFDYYKKLDATFSTYKDTSEVQRVNRGEVGAEKYSGELKKILHLAQKTKQQTEGYFDVYFNGRLDPSGIVKGYAIRNAAKMLEEKGYKNFYVEIAGDIEARGKNLYGKKWGVGIKNPFDPKQVIKIVHVSNKGVATSGNYARGPHIFNPLTKKREEGIASITVIGPNIYEADRFATAAFAMWKEGIYFIEKQKRLEGYMVTLDKIGTYTSGFKNYL